NTTTKSNATGTVKDILRPERETPNTTQLLQNILMTTVGNFIKPLMFLTFRCLKKMLMRSCQTITGDLMEYFQDLNL
mgnify:CR=1